MYRLSMKETNNEKRRRIGDLTLSGDEWKRVRLFNNLLEVENKSISLCLLCLTICLIFSTQIMRNTHFRLLRGRHFTMLFLQSSHSIPNGTRHPRRIVMHSFTMLLMRQCQNSMNIMSGQRNLMLISLPWVRRVSVLYFIRHSQICLALNPADKFEYFRKHWGQDLYEAVLTTVQERVCTLCIPFFQVLT